MIEGGFGLAVVGWFPVVSQDAASLESMVNIISHSHTCKRLKHERITTYGILRTLNIPSTLLTLIYP